MLDASQHWIVALTIQWGWSSKRRAFQDAFISKINQIFIFLIYLCVFVFIDLTPVTQLTKSGSSFNSVTVLFISNFSLLSSDRRDFLVLLPNGILKFVKVIVKSGLTHSGSSSSV